MGETVRVLGEVVETIKREASELAVQRDRYAPYRFNVFALCGVDAKESVHSRILAALLDPKGSHGLGAALLESFLRQIEVAMPVDISSVEVCTERWGGDAGRFDIYLSAPDWHVIIENKIYAAEGHRQLARYAEWLETKKNGYRRLLFLTIDGRESETADGASYDRLSYSRHIYPWIENCIQIAARAPLVRETLCQYQWTVKNLAGVVFSPGVDLRENVFVKYSRMAGFLGALQGVPEWYAWMIDRAALQVVLDFRDDIEDSGFVISEFTMRSAEKYARFYVDPVVGGAVRINFEFSAEGFCALSSGLYWRDKNALPLAVRERGISIVNGRKCDPHWLTKESVKHKRLKNWDENFLSTYLTDASYRANVLEDLKLIFHDRQNELVRFNDSL